MAIQQAQNKLNANGASKPLSNTNATTPATAPSQSSPSSVKPKPSVKLSYKEQRELEGLPALIESLEKEQQDIRSALADSSLFAKDPAKAAALFARDAQIDEALLAALERWEALSAA